MKKNNFFYLIIASFFIFLIYFLSGVYGYIEYKKFKQYLFDNLADLEFHYKYSNKINHLRAEKFNGKTTGYLFNNIGRIKSKNKVLAIGKQTRSRYFKNSKYFNYKNLDLEHSKELILCLENLDQII